MEKQRENQSDIFDKLLAILGWITRAAVIVTVAFLIYLQLYDFGLDTCDLPSSYLTVSEVVGCFFKPIIEVALIPIGLFMIFYRNEDSDYTGWGCLGGILLLIALYYLL